MTYSNQRYYTAMIVIAMLLCGKAGSGMESSFSPGDGLVGSLSVGRAYFSGEFKPYLRDAASFGGELTHPLSLAGLPLLFEGGFSASSHFMKESESSRFSIYSVHAGILGYYPLARWAYPYAGIVVQESYMVFTGAVIDEKETALKPGAGARAGLFCPLGPLFGLRATADYRVTPLSGATLNRYAFGLAAMLRLPFGDLARNRAGKRPGMFDVLGREERAESLASRGVYLLHKGESAVAEDLFKQAINIDPGNEKAASMLAKILAARTAYAEARSLVVTKRYYDAIPLLESSGAVIPEAARDLDDVRSILAADVPALEKKGIAAYESQWYDECIAIMKRIRLVDPENETVRLYLPRAEGRKRAIERLR